MAGEITVGPLVEIFLVTHLAILETVVAPFDALLAPARKAGQPLRVTPKAHPLNAEATAHHQMLQSGNIAMLDDDDGAVADLVKERLQV